MESAKALWLFDGPFAEQSPLSVKNLFLTEIVIKIPVDEQYKLADSNPFAWAIYEKLDLPTEHDASNLVIFFFRKFQKADEFPFVVEFADGPHSGHRSFHQPLPGLPETIMVPLPTPPFLGDGRMRLLAEYQKREGSNAFHFVKQHEEITKRVRIIFELVGGPFDGRTYDNDSAELDPEGAQYAQMFYALTQGGKINRGFRGLPPYAHEWIERFGVQAIQYTGAFMMHRYIITDRLEAPYEVYLRMEYKPEQRNSEQ